MSDLWAALCLVAVIEGLLLFVAPGSSLPSGMCGSNSP